MMTNSGQPPLEAKNEDAVWNAKITEERSSGDRTDRPFGYAEKADMDEKAERLENDKQRRGHRENLAVFIFWLCGVMLTAFMLITLAFYVWAFYTCGHADIPQTAWFFMPLALMGILPAAIILSLLKGLYKAEDQSECITAKDLTLASQLATVCKPIIGKT